VYVGGIYALLIYMNSTAVMHNPKTCGADTGDDLSEEKRTEQGRTYTTAIWQLDQNHRSLMCLLDKQWSPATLRDQKHRTAPSSAVQ
jgi:hypothetical protein